MESVIPLITHPISLCAYALSLVFGLVAIKKERSFFYLAVFVTVVSVIGGLFLAHKQINNVPAPTPVKSESSAQPSEQQKKSPVADSTTTQSSAGDQSPNISGAGGDVHLNYGNAAGAVPAEQKK